MDPVVTNSASNTLNTKRWPNSTRQGYMIINNQKECSICHLILDLFCYFIRSATGTPSSGACKICISDKNREKKKDDPKYIAWHKHREEIKIDGRSNYRRNADKICKKAIDRRNTMTEYGIPYGRLQKLIKIYKVTPEYYIQLLFKQNNKCPICEKDLPLDEYITKARDIVVDHCHITGKVRGVLCNNCNTGLGMFNDNINKLANAIKYLNNHGSSNYE